MYLRVEVFCVENHRVFGCAEVLCKKQMLRFLLKTVWFSFEVRFCYLIENRTFFSRVEVLYKSKLGFSFFPESIYVLDAFSMKIERWHMKSSKLSTS